MSERCKEILRKGSYTHQSRCKRTATRDGFCATHHPDAVKARRAAGEVRYKNKISEWQREATEKKQAAASLDLVRSIAEGAYLTMGDVKAAAKGIMEIDL